MPAQVEALHRQSEQQEKRLISCRLIGQNQLVAFLYKKYPHGGFRVELRHNCYHIYFPDGQPPPQELEVCNCSEPTCPGIKGLTQWVQAEIENYVSAEGNC